MTSYPAWKPTIGWHLKLLGALLLVCTAAYAVLAYAAGRLPAPYQQRQPAPETTPWLDSNR
ncbi:hypothetical protein [Candidatus Avelusimicrobium gallicola]|uniref:hypothetical protein n=1 Tax=Candidatus Avelusimicrobium gallicola TaxID=2562704 RepID=UPI001178B571|nr:hypothetical protein [Elusimicrobium sp. An273]